MRNTPQSKQNNMEEDEDLEITIEMSIWSIFWYKLRLRVATWKVKLRFEYLVFKEKFLYVGYEEKKEDDGWVSWQKWNRFTGQKLTGRYFPPPEHVHCRCMSYEEAEKTGELKEGVVLNN